MKAWFHRWTTETDVTNMRVVHKTGFIKRRTFEMALDKVESVDVNQSILGRILNYGDVTIMGVGEGKETITHHRRAAGRSAATSPRDRAASSWPRQSRAAGLDRRSRRDRQILETVGRNGGTRRQDGAAAQDQSAAAHLYPRCRRRKFERNVRSLNCLSGLRMLDIGCGAGLLCEPLTRLGAQVIGVDPSATNIAAAKLHADKGHLSIDYRCTTVEEMDLRERFDIVLAMEVVEHVTDVGAFIDRCAAMLKPGGLMVVSTLNRNWKSFALAIVGAEYVLRWLPRGTHQWDNSSPPTNSPNICSTTASSSPSRPAWSTAPSPTDGACRPTST